MGAEHEAVLGAFAHGLGIEIVALLSVLPEPSSFLPGLEVFDCLGIGLLAVLVGYGIEVYLRFGDVQQGFLSGLLAGFLGVQYVIGSGSDFLHEFLRRTYGCERLYFDHSVFLLWF